MDKSGGMRPPIDESPAVEAIGKFMAVGIVVLFLVVVFLFLFHLYTKWVWWRVEQTTLREGQNPRRRRLVFSAGQDGRKGLDPSVLRSLPVLVFSPEDFNEGLECAVCLSELEQGDEARLLPKCSHGFHVQCIDMWFQSNSTCPLCRSLVEDLHPAAAEEDSGSVSCAEVSSIGASVESDSASSPASAGMLIIDIPVHMTENLSSSSPSEELKSPMTMRLRSLKRLLSKEKRVCSCSSSCAQAGQNEPELIT